MALELAARGGRLRSKLLPAPSHRREDAALQGLRGELQRALNATVA